jgi:hypothetical protein
LDRLPEMIRSDWLCSVRAISGSVRAEERFARIEEWQRKSDGAIRPDRD